MTIPGASLEEKRYHYSPQMIARLFGVPPEKKETEATKYDAVTTLGNINIIIEKSGTPTRTLEPESVLNEKRLIAPQTDPKNNYPTKGVLTLGIIMTVVGLIIFSPLAPPSINSFVVGTSFFILGLSVIGAGIISSAEKQGAKTE